MYAYNYRGQKKQKKNDVVDVFPINSLYSSWTKEEDLRKSHELDRNNHSFNPKP